MAFIRFILFSFIALSGAVTFFIWPDPAEKGANKMSIAAANAAGQCSPLIMYSASWCSYCKRKREQMQSQQVAFTEYQVDRDPEMMAVFEEKLSQAGMRGSYPMFEINGQLFENHDLPYLVQMSCQ